MTLSPRPPGKTPRGNHGRRFLRWGLDEALLGRQRRHANSGKRWVNALPWRLTSWADLSPRVHQLVSKSPPDVLARRVEAKPAITVKVVVVFDLGP